MDRFQLEHLSDADLKRLRNDANSVLRERQRIERLYRAAQQKAEQAEYFESAYRNLHEYNCSEALALYPGFKNPNTHRYLLPSLLDQDWSSAYPESGGPRHYYVYAHVDPTKPQFGTVNRYGGGYYGRPFYVGKGSGNRAYDLKRNQGHGRILRGLLDSGATPEQIVKIVCSELTESKAFELEAKLVYFFGTIYDNGISHHNRQRWLVNLEVPAIPDFKGHMMSRSQWDKWADKAKTDCAEVAEAG